MKSSLVIQRLRELDPGSALEKTGQVALFGSLAAGQDYWQHTKFPLSWVGTSLKGEAHFLVVPRAEAMGTEEDETIVTLAECVFYGRLPGLARNKIPFVQPARYAAPFKLGSKRLDRRLVGTIMRQKCAITLISWSSADFHCFPLNL